MEKRKAYKVVGNIGYKNEEEKYFDKFTKNRLMEIKNYNSYVILYYDKFFKCYKAFDYKVNEYQKALFNENVRKYCERYV